VEFTLTDGELAELDAAAGLAGLSRGAYAAQAALTVARGGANKAGVPVREALVELRPGELRHLINVQPTPGLSNSEHHIFIAREVTQVGKPVGFESERVEWVPLSSVAIGPETP
jgi:hypothetical protein